jgi:hypothetical protein
MSYSVSPVPAPGSARTVERSGTFVSQSARWWFAGNAVVAWAGWLLQAWLTVGNVYPAVGNKYGEIDYRNADGMLGTLGHTFDFLTFFTTWANLLVAVTVTMLAIDPLRDSRAFRVVRNSALLMITITAIVYAVILAPGAVHVGWQVPMNVLMHQVTPLVTLVVWAVVGPRRWISWLDVPLALVIPVVWVVWMLVRGAVIEAYPYGFINVINLGYATALRNIVGILVAGAVLMVVLKGLDALLSRLHREEAPAASVG